MKQLLRTLVISPQELINFCKMLRLCWKRSSDSEAYDEEFRKTFWGICCRDKLFWTILFAVAALPVGIFLIWKLLLDVLFGQIHFFGGLIQLTVILLCVAIFHLGLDDLYGVIWKSNREGCAKEQKRRETEAKKRKMAAQKQSQPTPEPTAPTEQTTFVLPPPPGYIKPSS